MMDTPLHPKLTVECLSKINVSKVKLFSDQIIAYSCCFKTYRALR